MKFVNTVISGISIVTLLAVSGCAGKVQLPGVGEKVALMPTAQYIPKKTIEEGKEVLKIDFNKDDLEKRLNEKSIDEVKKETRQKDFFHF